VAVVRADAIRMRTEPNVDAGSDRYTPLLPKGTDLYVISGPKPGSGYHWYEVSPISFKVKGLVEWPQTIIGDGMTGWVPVADRDGEPWLAHGDAAGPPAPRDVESLAGLTIGARLACFSQVPITLQARLLQHGCDVDWSGEMRPSWFQDATDGLTLAPAAPAPVSKDLGCDTDVLFLHMDPDGTRPPRLPVDEVVTVTGTFDHPAAAACRFTPWEGAAVDSDYCRYAFAVTSIR
jgi:hypothetical protein